MEDKHLTCSNPECQNQINYGDPLYVLPYRDYIFCSTECYASYMGLYSIEKDDPENQGIYDLWWNDATKEG